MTVTDIPTGIVYEHPERLPASGADWPVDPGRSLLLVHDMQDHFVNKYQRDTEPIRSVIAGTRRLVDAARAAGVPVVFSAQPGDQDPAERGLLTEFWGRGPRTHATGLVPELGQVEEAEHMQKHRYSAFQRTDLRERLAREGRDTLVITGIYTNIGVKATALEAFMEDIRAVVVGDAVADFDAAEHRAGLEWVAARCGAVGSLEEVLRQWEGGSGQTAGESAGEPGRVSAALAEAREVLGLGVEQVSDAELFDADLLDAGLDSVRAMELADRLSMAGVEVPFETLISARTIRGWKIG